MQTQDLEAQVERLQERVAELEKQNRDLKTLDRAIHAANNVITIADARQPDMPLTFVNKAFEKLTGYRKDEAVGRNCRFLQGDDRNQEGVAALHDAVREGKAAHVELRNYRKDGTMFWNELYLTPVFDENGELIYFFGVQNDVTARKEAELGRRLAEAAVHNADESILVTDTLVDEPGPRIVYVNPAFTEMTGYTLDDVRGKSPRLLQGPKSDRTVLRRLRESLEAGTSFRGETVNYRKDGSEFIMEWHTAPIRENGAIAYWVATQRDVSERRRLERELLEISSREQQRVAQDLHDSLGQHLTGTALLAKLLVKRLEAHPGASPDIIEEAAKVKALVTEAGTMTRTLARGIYPVHMQGNGLMISLGNLAKTVTGFGQNCTFKYEKPVSISDYEKATHLYRIVQEATNNAMKYARAGHISISLAQHSGSFVLSVEDDGIGIPQEKLQSREGMGLRIMHYRAQLIGASLRAEPLAQGGTQVTCEFRV